MDVAVTDTGGLPATDLELEPRNWRAALRRALRSTEAGLIAACALTGVGVGGAVVLLHLLVRLLHRALFHAPPPGHLSTGIGLDRTAVALVPALGGLAVGLFLLYLRRTRAHDIVDPIEANALYGGRMSLADSARLVAATLLSNAAGASVGMEAAYSQIGAGIFSSIGQMLHLRRSDLRILTGAGAAAAIAAAFNAPLAGAFYGYELVLGSYTLHALAPVAVAAVAGTLVVRVSVGADPIFAIHDAPSVGPWDYAVFALVGAAAALLGIVTMKAVTWCERSFRKAPLPDWSRPAVGGLLLGLLALFYPQVLGSGQGAVQYHFQIALTLGALAPLLAAKVVASAISLGAGFRGGLFSSSLFLGCLFGEVLAQAAVLIYPPFASRHEALMLVGMGSVAAAIIGAPVTMVLLVLEMTADFPVTMGVLAGVVVATVIVRQTFGYSFATWRFHLRGVPIRGAHDVGWLQELKVGRMMRRDAWTAARSTPLLVLRGVVPLGSARRVFALDEDGHYVGVIDASLVHDPDLDVAAAGIVASDLATGAGHFLLADEDIRTALARFEEAELETLPVLASAQDRRVIGYLTESSALRRYARELERRRSAELGERNLFGIV